jgi:uncharacterized protein (DUF433 family)
MIRYVGMSGADHGGTESGLDVYDASAYRITDAARFLHLPASTLRWWVLGGEYRTLGGIDLSEPIITLADPERRLLSFRNLVEAHVLSALRRKHRVHLPAIRQAVRVLKREYGTEHPLADHRLETDGTSIFVREYGQLTNLNQHEQRILHGMLDQHAHRVEWDATGALKELFPFPSADLAADTRKVSINPLRGFGLPTIVGTGIRTDVIASRYRGGDTISSLARDYARPEDEITEALRYEQAA